MEPEVEPSTVEPSTVEPGTVEPGDVGPNDIEFDHEELRVFWELARYHAKLNAAPTYFGPTTLESVPPPAWTYGDSAEESDAFVEQALADGEGRTTAPGEDYDGDYPQAGVLSILCDGSGVPRALVELTDVTTSDAEIVESFRVVYQP